MTVDFKEIHDKWRKKWETDKVFEANPNDKEKFLEDLIQSYRKKLQNSDANSYHTSEVGFLEELLQAQIWKESNVNIRTILEYLMLKLG